MKLFPRHGLLAYAISSSTSIIISITIRPGGQLHYHHSPHHRPAWVSHHHGYVFIILSSILGVDGIVRVSSIDICIIIIIVFSIIIIISCGAGHHKGA